MYSKTDSLQVTQATQATYLKSPQLSDFNSLQVTQAI